MEIEMLGRKFGRLTVLERGPTDRNRERTYICACDCGNLTPPIKGSNLRRGTSRSCGCLQADRVRETSRKHGMSHTRIYKVWAGMKDRCTRPGANRYHRYGGRGIKVCREWSDSFQAFYDYVSKLPHFGEEGRSLDRIDNEGDYEPGNVRWATAEEQAGNRF